MKDALSRFSNRAENYAQFRPGYPMEIITLLQKKINLSSRDIIADIGSGTGKSAELFLKNGNTVYGIEPTQEMKSKAEQLLGKYRNFISLDGQAENTGLEDASVDIILAAQAFHWFNQDSARQEFQRILKDRGFIVLIWNERVSDTAGFSSAYEDLISRYGRDYKQVKHRNIDEKVFRDFFNTDGYQLHHFKNYQVFHLQELKGRLLSSSYMPAESDIKYPAMIKELEKIFKQYQDDDQIRFEYDTKVYYGRIT